MKYNILVGGAAGQGVDTLALMFEKLLKRRGYYVLSYKDYMSRVRGGHNFIQIRFGTEPIYSHWPDLDIIIALDKNTLELHSKRLSKDGIIICDSGFEMNDSRILSIPINKIASEVKNPKTSSSAALGAVLKVLSQTMDMAESIYKEKFAEDTLSSNLLALKVGYESSKEVFYPEKPKSDNHIIISGNQAIALAALAGGVGLYASYPMTPATSIMTYLSHKQREAGILVEQVEDEIAAINMALGSSYAGLRSMAGTSGGGLALMVEGISLQGVMELPLVLVNSQRPGPATGLPTRTGQEDLLFAINAGHGEFPKMVLSVKNPEDAFYQTIRALNLADKYNLLVIILTDQYAADTAQTIEPFDFHKVKINRLFYEPKEFKSYEINESGVSPRIIPGKTKGKVVLADSHEHDEYGHITEDMEIRNAMVIKRMKKLQGLSAEILEPDYFGVDNPEVLLIGWGSMYGPLREAVDLLANEGKPVGCLIFGDLYPLPTKLLSYYSQAAKKLVNVEQNFTGQLGKLISQEAGITMTQSLLKFDGRQLSSKEIYTRVLEEVL